MKRNVSIFIVVLLFFPFIVSAHPGRTDSSGCHTCRTNCPSWGLYSGEYHCHRAKTTVPQPVEPIRSHKVEDGTGYTTPAPDYKIPNPDTVTNINNTESKTDNIDVPSKDSSQKFVEGVDKDSDGSSWFLLLIIIAGGAGYAIAKMRKK